MRGTELAKKWHIAKFKFLEDLQQSKARIREWKEEDLDLLQARTDLLSQIKTMTAAPTQ